jgi:hypothetical protein
MITTIKSATVGHRAICGTDWPVEHVAERHATFDWVLVKYLCNGIPDSFKRFRTRRELLAAFDALTAPT